MRNKYALLLKTGESEIRAISQIPDKKNILPIIELTRGRRSIKDTDGDIKKKIEKIEQIFSKSNLIIDLTSQDYLSNDQIKSLYSPKNGYENWIQFTQNLKNRFANLYPTIIIDPDDDDFDYNFKSQISKLVNNFNGFAYRCDIEDDVYKDDLFIIKSQMDRKNIEFFFVIDFSLIKCPNLDLYIKRGVDISIYVKKECPAAKIIVVSTSFPNTNEFIKDKNRTIELLEQRLVDGIKKENIDVIYGDYGSINPIRNDEAVMRRGWSPRIDMALKDKIYFYRESRDGRDYTQTYKSVAENEIGRASRRERVCQYV